MKLGLAAIAALMIGLFATCASVAADDVSQAYTHVKPALVKVWAFDASGLPIDSGTGFVVQSNDQQSWIVTALHVVSRASRVTIDTSREARDLPTSVVARTTDQRDLVLLLVPRGNLRAVQFAAPNHSMIEGKYVATAGFFKFDERIGMSGQLAQLVGPGTIGALPDDGKFIEVNLDLEPGLSGAPLFDPATGDVVGVVDAKSTVGSGGYAISAGLVLLDFLRAQQVVAAVTGVATPVAVARALARPVTTTPPQAAVVALAPVPVQSVAVKTPAPATPRPTAVPATPAPVRVTPLPVAVTPVPVARAPLAQTETAADRGVVDRCFGRIFVRAEQMIAACTDLIASAKPNSETLTFLYGQRCSANRISGQWGRAIDDCTAALRLDPSNAIAYAMRARAYVKQHRFGLGIDDANEALRIDPNSSKARVARGCGYLGSRQGALAVVDFAQAVHFDPSNAEAQRLAEAHSTLGGVAPGGGGFYSSDCF